MKLLYWLGWILVRFTAVVFFRLKVMGRENIPPHGAFIMAPNHISYVDPPLAGSSQKREVHFMAKKSLFRNKLFGYIISATNAHPISRGAVDRKSFETAANILKKGDGLVVFPEGTRSKTDDFLPPRPGIGMIARKSLCPICPTYINGTNRLWDCFIGRDRLGINYGRTITADELEQFEDNKDGYRLLAENVMERIRELKKEYKDRLN